MTGRTDHVRYVTPFAATASLPAWQAEGNMEREAKRWALLSELDMLSDAQRAVGPPRIEDDRPDDRRP